MSKYYAVNLLRDKLKVEVLGRPTTIDLNWADGMIGCIPLFNTHDSALHYADGDKNLITPVRSKK